MKKMNQMLQDLYRLLSMIIPNIQQQIIGIVCIEKSLRKKKKFEEEQDKQVKSRNHSIVSIFVFYTMITIEVILFMI
jgi:hypothetical protein